MSAHHRLLAHPLLALMGTVLFGVVELAALWRARLARKSAHIS